jgi:F-type H+-transporting ATPase subunit delta
MIRRFARPYAKAFTEVVPTPAEAQKVHDELARFEAARHGSAELTEVFASPGVDSSAKQNIARQIASRLGMSELAAKIVEVLVRNQRVNDLGDILAAWQAMIHEQTGVAVARVRTAHELDDAEREKLRQSLERRFGRRIDLRLSQDPSLLGGFVAEVESEVYDASVAGRIARIRQSISQ